MEKFVRFQLPPAEKILRDLIVLDGFVPEQVCNELVAVHQRFGSANQHSDNGFYVPNLKHLYPALFWTVRAIIHTVVCLIQQHFAEAVGCDLALLCGITGAFRHTLHADNSYVFCPRHGNNAEELRMLQCRCEDIEIRPNHTFWRRYSVLMYLDDDHEGGDIVFGEGPNVFGAIYRKEIVVTRGLLVLSPSNELYHHRTTPVERGTRYSLNTWFTADADRFCESLIPATYL